MTKRKTKLKLKLVNYASEEQLAKALVELFLGFDEAEAIEPNAEYYSVEAGVLRRLRSSVDWLARG